MEKLKIKDDQDTDLILGILVASLTQNERADLADLLKIWDDQVLKARIECCSFFDNDDDLIVCVSPLEEEPRFKHLSKMMINHTREYKGNVRFMQIYRGLKKITQTPII